MRITQRIILFTFLWVNAVAFNAAYAVSCPSVATAIQQLGATHLSTAIGSAGNWHYTGTSSYDNSTVDYYTTILPTMVTPNHQLQRLESVLGAPSQLSAAGVTPVVCAYLGSLNNAAPVYDTTWQQAIIITSTGSSPEPTPPGPVQPSNVNLRINTGDVLPGATTIPISLVNSKDKNSYSQTIASGSNVDFGTVLSGTYTVTVPSYLQIATGLYILSSGEEFSFTVPANVTQATLKLDYKKEPDGSPLVLVTVGNDGSIPYKYLGAAVTVTFTNTTTQQAITQQITLDNGTALDVPLVMSAGTYSMNLTPPTADYDVLTPTNSLVVANAAITTVNFDYKYYGTYRYLTAAQYNQLVSTRDQRIDLGQGEIGYHCIFQQGQTVPSQCIDQDNFQFPKAQVVFNNNTISEDKLWAMSLAQASMLERTELNYGRTDVTNTPYYQNVFVIGKDPNVKTLGDYLNYNMGPNYFIARCLQEGNKDCLINGKPVDDCTGGAIASGSFQLDSWAIMFSAYQGYPMPFKVVKYGYCTRSKSIHSPLANVPGSSAYEQNNFVGGALSSAMYDASSYLNLGPTPGPGQQNGTALQQLVAGIGEPLMTESLSSVLYNAGYSSLETGIMVDTRPQCIAKYLNPASVSGDIRWDTLCFNTASSPNSPAALYSLQLPYYDHEELQVPTRLGAFIYSTKLSWADINYYLDLIGPLGYGFYDNYDISIAKAAAQAEFNTLAGSGTTIDFQTQFSNILNAFMQKLPVYIAQVDIPDPSPASLTVRVAQAAPGFFMQVLGVGGFANVDLPSGKEYDFHSTDKVVALTILSLGSSCGAPLLSALNQNIATGTGETLILGTTGSTCTLTPA